MPLSQIHTCTPAGRLMGVEDGGEKAEGKSTNAEREVEAPGVAKWLESPSALRSRSLALGARRSFQSGILGLLASSPIQWDNGLSADPGLTHRALLPLRPGLQPLMKTGPTVQVATHTDHSFPSSLQTYITFEGRARPAPLAVWPFGAPVLLLGGCHGPSGVAPAYPSDPPNTQTHAPTHEEPPPAHEATPRPPGAAGRSLHPPQPRLRTS